MKRPPKIAFDKAMDQIDNMKAIHSYLETSAKNLDASAILRAQLLLAVSAVDTYLHAAVSDVLHQKFFQGQGGLLEKAESGWISAVSCSMQKACKSKRKSLTLPSRRRSRKKHTRRPA